MRQRKLKHLDERLALLDDLMVKEPVSNKGKWREVLGKSKDCKLYLEIGSGKGRFITNLALRDTESMFIAIEGQESVALRAMESLRRQEVKNVAFLLQYIDDIRDMFEDGELDGIYLNFSDPWPKARHAKRRLTYRKRLMQYAKVVGSKGFIQFKTDNDPLFEFSLEEIEFTQLPVIAMTRDLHNSELFEGNVMTEYEEKFSRWGKSINYVKIKGIDGE